MTLKTIVATAAAGIFSAGVAQAGQVVPERTSPEPGYVISGATLSFPGGGSHTATPEALREVYGLIGPDNALLRTKFVDPQGNTYQVGYWLEGSTLHFPGEGLHEMTDAAPETAQAIFRETYGLVGDRDALVRTKW
jgi:hypothetical protein